MWMGACTSSIGTWMQLVAQAWLVYRLSNSAFYLGLDTFCGQIPIFLFSLFGGVIADRKSRRHILLASQFVQMGSAFVLMMLAILGQGVVLGWRHMIDGCLDAGLLVPATHETASHGGGYYVISPNDRAQNQAARLFTRWLVSQAGRQTAV